MGGHAFASGAYRLYTPRMPPYVYQHVLNYCHTRLQELFDVVATPVPGPAKRDHGDIDILLAQEKSAVSPSSRVNNLLTSLSPSNRDPLEAATHLLNAKKCIKEQPNVVTSAIPWPNDLPKEESDDSEHRGDKSVDRYIQVDLRLCDSPEHLRWMLFKDSHGGFCIILGSIIRPYGLTMDQSGLHIRIPEIENLNKKQARVLLSANPTDILKFLGLCHDSTRWEEPFDSDEDLFEYATTCRLFQVQPKPEQDENSATEGGEIDNSKAKSKELRTMIDRPIFRKWVEEFLPACRKSGRFVTTNATRDSVRAEAFEHFPGTKQAYEARIFEWNKERQRQTLFREVIKTSIPESDDGEEDSLSYKIWRSRTANALKKIIMQDDYKLGIHPPTPLRDASGIFDEEQVRQFVVDNWKQVGDAAAEECQRQYEERLAKKAAESTS